MDGTYSQIQGKQRVEQGRWGAHQRGKMSATGEPGTLYSVLATSL